MRDQAEFVPIEVERLRIGLFIQLNLSWVDHPFFSNSFKIANPKQLATLKKLGVREILYCPAKSDCAPLPAAEAGKQAEVAAGDNEAAMPSADVDEEELAALALKRDRIERLKRHKESVRRCEQALLVAGRQIKAINENLFSKSNDAVRVATQLINQMADALLTDKDVAIHAINDKVGSEEVYYHALNVTVLSLLLARELDLPDAQLRQVGLGALFHDIGKRELPDWLLRKRDGLTRTEMNLLAQHVAFGEKIGAKLELSADAMDIIRMHHESADGSGYPRGLRGEDIPLPCRIVSVVNCFDNLCNPRNLDMALTPHEAVSQMFAKARAQFDSRVLTTFIRFMGVYPPGTLVRLSNDFWGLVMTVNMRTPLKPGIMLFDPAIPKEEAILLDLKDEPQINISKACRPSQLPEEAIDYLSPRKRVTYYFDEDADGGA